MKLYPILAISGPRQSGKTTMLRDSFPEYEYLSMEDVDARNFLANDPKGFFERYNKYYFFLNLKIFAIRILELQV